MKCKIPLLILLVLFFVSGCVRLFHPEYTVVLTSGKIEEKLQRKFPIKERLGNFVLVFENPKVKIKENSIFIKTDFYVKFLEISFSTGEIAISGEPVMDKIGKNIYLRKPKVEELRINGKEMLSSDLKRAVETAISKMLKKMPVFRLKNKIRIKSIKIQDGKIYVKLQL